MSAHPMAGRSPVPWAPNQDASASIAPTAAPASSPPAIPAPKGRTLMCGQSPFPLGPQRNPPPRRNASGRMRGCGPSALGELQVELALVSRDPDAARGQRVEVLGLPVQEAVLLEVLHGARD